MRLQVGTDSLRGDIRAYARRFDLLELFAEKGRLPRIERLREMRGAVTDEFVFSVRVGRRLATLEVGAETEQAKSYALEVAAALGARFLVLQTPHTVMPTARVRRRLVELARELDGDYELAWEPHGLWQDDDAAETAEQMGAVLVRDLSREAAPESSILYTRLRALGRSGVSVDGLDRTALALAGADEAFVIIEGEGAVRAAATLRETLKEAFAEDDDADQDDDEEDEDDSADAAEGEDEAADEAADEDEDDSA